MKTPLFLFLSLVFAAITHGQGLVFFSNDSDSLSSPPDRLIRFASGQTPGNPFGTNNAPAVGSNYLVQLYFGSSTSSESSLVPLSTAPGHLRESTTSLPGVWAGIGNRTLDGFDFTSTVTLQVRVWDYFDGATYDEAVSTNPFGVSGKSLPFSYYITPFPGPAGFIMDNFQGFSLPVPEPSAVVLFGLALSMLFGRHQKGTASGSLRKC